ncbi:DUF167 domain-containing protein [Thalassiella azotivora]
MAVRVRPGASRTTVGGEHGGALVVRVGARAVDGAATRATLDAVARALGVRRSQVSLVTGATSRDKVLLVAEADATVAERLDALRADPVTIR